MYSLYNRKFRKHPVQEERGRSASTSFLCIFSAQIRGIVKHSKAHCTRLLNSEYTSVKMNGRFWKSTRTTPLLWEFLLSLLQDSECREFIKWLDESAMTFKIVNSYQVATLWGEIKGRPNMDQNKLRRAIRQYYKSGVMKKVLNIMI